MDEIKIAYDMEDIDKKSESEKLSLLLKIAFANHTTLMNHGKILFGNGKEGFDLKDHFSRREENALKRIECFWFKKSNI